MAVELNLLEQNNVCEENYSKIREKNNKEWMLDAHWAEKYNAKGFERWTQCLCGT